MAGVDAVTVDAVIGAWLAEQARAAAFPAGPSTPAGQAPREAAEDNARTLLAVAVDGKTVRGAVGADGDQVHLLRSRAAGSATAPGSYASVLVTG